MSRLRNDNVCGIYLQFLYVLIDFQQTNEHGNRNIYIYAHLLPIIALVLQSNGQCRLLKVFSVKVANLGRRQHLIIV